MPTIIKIKERQADKLYECAEKVHRGAKKLMKFLSQKSLMSATAVAVMAVMAVVQAVIATKTMTTMRTTTSVEVYPAPVDMVVVDTVEDAATNN